MNFDELVRRISNDTRLMVLRYDGKMIFMEPMITKAYLESHPNLTEQLKLPQAYQKSGYYPTTYTVRYNASTKEYMVTLGNMVKR